MYLYRLHDIVVTELSTENVQVQAFRINYINILAIGVLTIVSIRYTQDTNIWKNPIHYDSVCIRSNGPNLSQQHTTSH